jgi:GT2 family glycosyltransferase
MPSPRPGNVSVVIVTWNSAASIEACLASVVQPCSRHVEVIVVDNNSDDATVDKVRRAFPQVIIVQTGTNAGFARAVNIGISHATGQHILWLNPDAHVREGALDALADFLEAKPDAGAAGPLIRREDGTRDLFAARQLPSLTNAALRQFGLRRLLQGHRWFAQETASIQPPSEAVAVECLTGAALMMRSDVANLVGPLNTEMPMYFEDLDYCARLRRRGFVSYCVPRAEVVHGGGRSAELSPARTLLYAMENGQAPWLFLLRFRGKMHATLFRVLILTANLMRLIPLSIMPDLDERRSKARALVWWAMTPRNVFEREMAAHFTR